MDMQDLGGPTNFSAALATWKQINLAELQKTLDKQGLEIVDGQKENMVGRKKLAEQTREFKKVPDDEKGPAFKTLLKAYQSEIDALTRRSKHAENAFLNVYKLLAEAPDPFPLLDAAVDQTARASEARLLESEVARQKEEAASLKQQLLEAQTVDKERKKLQDKVDRFEIKMEEMIQDKVGTKEAELHATYDERLRNYEERETDLSRQLTVSRNQLRELRTTNDSSQAKLFDHSQRQDQETVARLAEADLVTEDLERANKRVADVERRNVDLRKEIEAVRSGSEAAARVASLESQISDLQTEAARLLRALETQKDSATVAAQQAAKRVDELDRDLAALHREKDALENKVEQFRDYDELKRELDIMKFVEFSGMDVDYIEEEDADMSSASLAMPNPNADKANRQRGKPLENLLMAKNRKLQDELTQMRVAHEELLDEHRTISADLEGLASRFEEQRTLNDRLENDLLRINQASESQPGGGGASNNTPRGLTSSSSVAEREDPLASLNVGSKPPSSSVLSTNPQPPSSTSAATAATVVPPAPTSSAETSILPIITSQRDRFRQRNAELEEELRRQFEALSSLRGEIKALQTDNLKLYEKVRYLQSYRDESGASASGAGIGSRAGTAGKGRDEELGKYQNKYEESMNPFEAFRGRERGRAVQMLNPLEKVLLSLASVVLSNRLSRNVFVLYAFVLHFVVLSALYGAVISGEAAGAVVPPI